MHRPRPLPSWPNPALARAILPWVTFALASGCYRGVEVGQADGAADGSGGTDGSSAGESDDDTGEAGCAQTSVSPLRRLSEAQYRNTLRDLFAPAGIDVTVEAAGELDRIPVDDAGSTFGILDARVSDQHARAYYRLADKLAGLVANDPTHLAAVAGDCATAGTLDAACLDALLDDFGRRSFRRPLDADERATYHALAAQADTAVEAYRSVIFSLLLSPQFLYHVEVDGDGDDALYTLDGYALASRLSFHFWRTMPDDELFAAAADGSLLTDEGYLAQLERVFDDPRTADGVDRFYDELLRLGGITSFPATPAFATFAEDLGLDEPDADHLAAAQDEVHALVRHFTFDEDGDLADLWLTDLSLTQSPHLAAIYGVPVWDGVSEPPRMPAGERAGLLTRTALLLTGDEQTHPVHRGAAIRRRILCDDLPAPDPTMLPPGALDRPPVTADQTTRARYEAKTADGQCQGCHTAINPVGFVLERYDAFGRYRTQERVIDEATGEVLATLPIDDAAAPGLAGDDAVISGGIALSEQVVASGRSEACFAQQYFRAGFGREDGSDDACTIDRVEAALRDGGSLRAAMHELALDTSFRTRRVQ